MKHTQQVDGAKTAAIGIIEIQMDHWLQDGEIFITVDVMIITFLKMDGCIRVGFSGMAVGSISQIELVKELTSIIPNTVFAE